MTTPTAVLNPVQVEVGSPAKGYRWVNGFEIIQPNGLALYPYMRIREAKKFCKDQGWSYREAE